MRIPKYQIIKNDLINQITSGQFQSGDRFYTEAELTKLHNVSSITVIRALNDLVKDGYLVRHQGKGTFVARSRAGKAVAFSDLAASTNPSDKVSVLSMKRDNQAEYLEKLNLPEQGAYYKIIRVTKSSGTPYLYQVSYLPEQYIKAAKPTPSQYASIEERLKLDTDINLANEPFVETLEVLFPAPKEAAQALGLTTNQPLVLQTRTTKRHGSLDVIEHSESYKSWENFKVEISGNLQ